MNTIICCQRTHSISLTKTQMITVNNALLYTNAPGHLVSPLGHLVWHSIACIWFATQVHKFILVKTVISQFLPTATNLRQGNVFTPVSDSVHRGRFSVPACTTGHMTRGGFCLGVSLSWGSLPRGSLCPGGVSVWAVCPGGGYLLGRPPPHGTVTSRWYASYWNAFLFFFFVWAVYLWNFHFKFETLGLV